MARFATRATLPPTHDTRERELADLARLASVGCRDVRIRIPWEDFVPRPGHVDEAARERLSEFAGGAASLGLRPHASLCGRRLPGWFIDERAFSDERRADRHWSFFVDEVVASISDCVGGVIPFENPFGLLTRLEEVALNPDNPDMRRFFGAVGCVALLHRRTATLCEPLRVTCVLDRPALLPASQMPVFAALPIEAARALIDMMRDTDGTFTAGIDVSAHPLLASRNESARWADLTFREALNVAGELPSCRISVIGIPDHDEPDAVADFAQAAVGVVSALDEAGVEVDMVWLGDHVRMPSELFGSILPPSTAHDDN